MFSKKVLTFGIITFILGIVIGFSIFLLSPGIDSLKEDQEFKDAVEEFRTYMQCIPPSHEELMISDDTWLHYNFDKEGELTMIEIETSKNPDSPAWRYLPEGHSGMEFEH
jgi:hypothetical protein